MCIHVCALKQVWESEDKSQELALSYHVVQGAKLKLSDLSAFTVEPSHWPSETRKDGRWLCR